MLVFLPLVVAGIPGVIGELPGKVTAVVIKVLIKTPAKAETLTGKQPTIVLFPVTVVEGEIMKLLRLTFGLIPLLGGFAFAPPLSAQCIQADVSVQYNISGSRTPTERNNDVDLQSRGTCRGNASVTTGVQGNEGGTGNVRQSRTVRHRFDNGDRTTEHTDGSTVQIQSNPTIDVYNAADSL